MIAAISAGCAFVCFRKGKEALGWLGVAGVFPALAPLGIGALLGAVRLAKPDSDYARANYGPVKMKAARLRFPDRAPAPSASAPSERANAPTERRSGDREETIRRFLDDAAQAKVIDSQSLGRLRELLWRQQAPSGAEPRPSPPAPPARPEEASSASVLPSPPSPPDELAPEPARPEVVSTPPKPPPAAPRPAAPPQPGPVSDFLSKTWEAVVSDIAIHGLAYLGVVLTFVGVLGFLLFAFADMPDAIQPAIELVIALVFFGWAWMLRRQEADRVASGMELIGGMVVPLILFASLVDNAPFPPDVTGAALVVALPVASLALAGVYTWITARNRRSTLRYLVFPLLWLGAMTAGFAFKTDEPLVGPAITRLVSPQPALAAAAIGLTLVFMLRIPHHRLAGPTIRAALVGAPFAYLIAISLSVGEGWVLTWPLVLLGLSLLVSAEALAAWFEKRHWMLAARPVLVVGVLGPLVPAIGATFVGLAAVVIYAALFEESRHESASSAAIWLSLTGVAAGLVMTFASPVPALISFTLASLWAHVRRFDEDPGLRLLFMSAASLLPVGVLLSLDSLIGFEAAGLILASVVLVLTVAIRVVGRDDLFWSYWVLAADAVLGLGAAVSWSASGMSGLAHAITVLLVAASIAAARRWETGRLWLAMGAASGALAMFLEEAAVAVAHRQILFSVAGVLVLVVGTFVKVDIGGHLAAIGHVLSTVAAASLFMGGPVAPVLGAWTAGWIVSVAADELDGNSLTRLLTRVLGRESDGSAPIRWLVPILVVVSIPPTLLTTADLWIEFGEHRSWTGVLVGSVGLVYAASASWLVRTRPLLKSLAWGALVTSVIGVSVAPPDAWPTIYAAAVVIAVALLISRNLDQTWFFWFAWVMTVAVALLVSSQLGVGGESLHLVSLAWGGVMLVGGLVLDDTRSGRRRVREGLRTGWLRYPVILGGLVLPASLGPAFVGASGSFGWWALGASAVYFGVAWLTRVGAVSGPAYALASLGLALVIPWSITRDPWLLVFLAAPMIAVSSLRRSRRETIVGAWLRWDLPPLLVAHGVAAVGLTFAIANEVLPPAALAFGTLSVATGLLRRGRAWVEAGNLMVLAAAGAAGVGWLALALAATSLRGIVSAPLAPPESRDSYRAIAVIGAGLAWLGFLAWSGMSAADQSSYSMLAFGATALGVSMLGRWWRLSRPTTLWWGGLVLVGIFVTGVATVAVVGGPDGPLVAVGLVMAAAGFDLSWKEVSFATRYLAIVTTGTGWAALVSGLGWGVNTAITSSALLFGLTALLLAELARILRPMLDGRREFRDLMVGWSALASTGVVVAALWGFMQGALGDVGYVIVGSLAAAGFASARSASAVKVEWLRDLAAVWSFAALSVLFARIGLSAASIAAIIVSLAAVATFGGLAIWRRHASSVWTRPTIVFAALSNFVGVALASSEGSTLLWTGFLLSIGVQAIAVGLVRSTPGVLAIGPPALGLAFILTMSESLGGSAQWLTIPAGLVLLAEVEIFRSLPGPGSELATRQTLTVLEWIGLGILAAPSLVEMFTSSLFAGLTALAVAVLAFVWGVATKVKRRVISAASLALATLVLLIFAAGAGRAPDSAFFWIVAIGVGFAVMLVAGLVEAYRSKKGRIMARVDQLMEGWE